jgi:hypothetical protein
VRVIASQINQAGWLWTLVSVTPDERQRLLTSFGKVDIRCGGLFWKTQGISPGHNQEAEIALVLVPEKHAGAEALSAGMVLRFADDPMPPDEVLATRGKLLQLALLARMIDAEGFQQATHQLTIGDVPEGTETTMKRLARLCWELRDELPTPAELQQAEDQQAAMVARQAMYG